MFAADKLAGLRPNHYFLLQTRTYLFCRNVKIEIRLQPKPKLRRCAEITGKTESCLSRYTTLPQDNFIDPPWRHTNVERQAVLAQRHWFQKFLHQNLTGVDGMKFLLAHDVTPLVIIRYLDLIGIPVSPLETEPPLIVDPDTVLPCAIPGKLLQPIRRRDPQIIYIQGVIQHAHFPQCDLLDVCWQFFRSLASINLCRLRLPERSNHDGML
jgi:hypothetical protein